MRKAFPILLFTVFIILLAAVCVNPLVIFLAKKQLSVIFKESEVSIGSSRLNLKNQFSLFDISIKRKPAYDFFVKEARVEFSIFSLFKHEIFKFSLSGAKIDIDLPQKSIVEFPKLLKLGPESAFLIKLLEFSGLHISVNTKDFNVSAVLSSQINLSGQKIDYLEVKVDDLGVQDFKVSGLALKVGQGFFGGYLTISQVKYDKLNISDVVSQVKLIGKELFLERLSARVFDGSVGGSVKINIVWDIGCAADLKIINIDIDRFISDFNLKEKFEMTGRLNGDLVFESKIQEIKILKGKLFSREPGGILIIKDTKFLEGMARRINQSPNLLVENFRNYHYNVGVAKLFLENNDLILDTALNGETGKRDISIVLRDFKLRKERR